MLTKGAIGNLVNRYRAVLKKCNLINTFGSLAVASMLVLGGASVAMAVDINETQRFSQNKTYDEDVSASGIEYHGSEAGGVLRVIKDVELAITGKSTFTGNKNIKDNSNESGVGGVLSNGFTYSENERAHGGTVTFGGAAEFRDNFATTTGGAVFNNNGNITFSNTAKFVDNSVEKHNKNTENQGGGAIYQNGGSMTFTGVATFTGNKSGSYGGAVHNNGGTMTFKDSATFSENEASVHGGAMRVSGGAVTFEKGVSFKDNKASSSAALYVAGGSVTFKDTATFKNNDSTSSNSAITNYGTINLENGIDFTGNNSTTNGAFVNQERGIVNISGGTVDFSENSGSSGGAIQNAGVFSIGTADSYVDSITFSQNTSSATGGAIDNSGTMNIYGNNISFSDNTGAGKYGSAIFNSSDMKIIGDNIEFSNNKELAGFESSNESDYVKAGGGAIHNRGNADDTSLTLGKAGGTITFTNNSAHNGGAILARAVDGNGADSVIVIDADAIFADNTAGAMGGAVYNYQDTAGGKATITFNGDSTFTGNTAGEKGGAIYNTGTITFEKNVSFSGNTAAGKPNDIHNDGTLTINGTATFDGGISGEGKVNGNGTIVVNDKAASFEGKVEDGAKLTAKGSANLNDQTGGDIEALNKQLANLKSSDGKSVLTAVGMDEGLISGEVIVDGGKVIKKTSTILEDTLDQATAAPLAVNRILMNDVRKRMGDLRDTKEDSGVWMRWDGGKLKGDEGLTNNFNTIQIGADMLTGIKNVRAGVAGSFTHGDVDHNNGDGEMEAYTFAAYGTWMADNGMFADVIARVGFNNTELNIKGGKADLDNEALSLSAEYGWRFDLGQQFFVEPQAELTYTHVTGADFTIKTASYDVDSMDSLLGRAGLAAGWKLPNARGNVYARASVVHEFLGDAKITGTNRGNSIPHEIDGEDTWLEYGIGANVKLTDNTYVWADVERTEGAEIDEEWRGTVGIRYSF